MKNLLTYKAHSPEVKDVDVSGRTVTGYFSKFGTVDADGDMIVKGAFTKTIQENGSMGKNRIVHLYQHDVNKVLGKPHVLKEDDYGLYFETKFADVSYAKDVLKLYEAGVINEHSIGFQIVKGDTQEGYYQINEVKLYEGSTVTFGANEDTPFLGFKGQFDKANGYIKKCQKLLKDGDLTDETFYLLEYQLKQLERVVEANSQQADEPQVKHSDDLLPSINEAFDLLTLKLFNPKI